MRDCHLWELNPRNDDSLRMIYVKLAEHKATDDLLNFNFISVEINFFVG